MSSRRHSCGLFPSRDHTRLPARRAYLIRIRIKAEADHAFTDLDAHPIPDQFAEALVAIRAMPELMPVINDNAR